MSEVYTALFLVSCFTVGNVRNSFNSDGWKEIKPNEANVVSENSLLVTKEQDKKELLYQRVLKKTEEEKWGRGREGEETEKKGIIAVGQGVLSMSMKQGLCMLPACARLLQ